MRKIKNLKICIDPGHGGTQGKYRFRIGQKGLSEEKINLEVALALHKSLTKKADVVLTRKTDEFIHLVERVGSAVKAKCNMFLSIHHAVIEDKNVNFSAVNFHGKKSLNPASADFAKEILYSLKSAFKQDGFVYSDHIIFDEGFHVLKNTNNFMPSVLTEAFYITYKNLNRNLKELAGKEALAIYEGILKYSKKGIPFYYKVKYDKKYVTLHLDDGFGGNEFSKKSLKVFINEDGANFAYNKNKSEVKIKIGETFTKKTNSVRVFAKNKWGNALHPKPIPYFAQFSSDEWHKRYLKAKKDFLAIKTAKNSKGKIKLVEKAIKSHEHSIAFYRILVNPNAQEEYRRLLKCYEMLGQKKTAKKLKGDILEYFV